MPGRSTARILSAPSGSAREGPRELDQRGGSEPLGQMHGGLGGGAPIRAESESVEAASALQEGE